jgi:hypothetical protein
MESATLASGSDRVRVYPPDGTGWPGMVIFGDATPPARPTDPDVGWPPSPGNPFGRSWPFVIEGYAYPITSFVVDGARTQLTFDVGAPMDPWCELQTPVALDASGESFGCLPNTGFTAGEGGCSIPSPIDGHDMPVDCGKLTLCLTSRACACDAASCEAPVLSGAIDMHVSGDDATGQLSGLLTSRIYLTR